MTHMPLPVFLQYAVLVGLLAVSGVAYAIALVVLFHHRTLPEQVAPDRVTLVALALAAGKVALGPTASGLQPTLMGLCMLACGYAVVRMLQTVVKARSLPLEERRLIDSWSAVLIPPIIGIAILAATFDINSDTNMVKLLDLAIVINLIPGIYLLLQIPAFVRSRSRA